MGILDRIFTRRPSQPQAGLPRRGTSSSVSSLPPDPDDAEHGPHRAAEYRAVRALGDGAQGTVVEVEHVPTGRHYALKTAPRRCGSSRPRELEVLRGLQHPNIVQLVDWFYTKSSYHMVFELATGGELLERLVRKGRYTESDAAAIAATLFGAVAFMHCHDVAHLDIKTANILFKDKTVMSELLLVDFGVARSSFQKEEDWRVGTLYYQAPEIVAKKPYLGKPADVYSLGVVVYTLLSGINPFFAAPPHLLNDHVKQGRWTFHRSFESVSPEAKDFISRCLKTDPAERMTAVDAMDHPWILKYCNPVRGQQGAGRSMHGLMRISPQEYRDWLLQINEDLLEFEKFGMHEQEKCFVDSIKSNPTEWTMGHKVSDKALPERPWRKPVTPLPPDSDPSVVGNVPEGAAPAAEAGPPGTPADKAHPVAVIEDGGHAALIPGAADGGAPKEVGVLHLDPPDAPAVRPAHNRITRLASQVMDLDRRTEPSLPRASALTLRKSSNMVFRGAEVGVLGFADSMRAVCAEGHAPGECVCSPVDEQVNLAPQVKANAATLPRR
ncbi:kinase-like domain-containing protein [Hyaloraphidium curvatum]|nr:kinase-like domain-containing protein [Hyaloraphidium curvatum]